VANKCLSKQKRILCRKILRCKSKKQLRYDIWDRKNIKQLGELHPFAEMYAYLKEYLRLCSSREAWVEDCYLPSWSQNEDEILTELKELVWEEMR